LQIKYPIAKALLHLMAAYLCENVVEQTAVAADREHRNVQQDICGEQHRRSAYQELTPLGKIS
jgi:hypothetical protein